MKNKIKRLFWYRVFVVSSYINDFLMNLVLKSMRELNSMIPDDTPNPKSSFSEFIKDTEKNES